MDETRELTAERRGRRLASCEQDDLRKGLEAVAGVVEECVVSSSASTDGADFAPGAQASLEALIEAFGFERGFFLAQRSSSSATTEEIVGASDLEVLASRASCPEGGTSCWKEVTNPDFALDRAAVTEALESGEVVAIDRHVEVIMFSGLFTDQRIHTPSAVDPQPDTRGRGRTVRSSTRRTRRRARRGARA